MRIVNADDDDARLAVSAIYRLGNIVSALRFLGQSSSGTQLDCDRRYEQLVECIELRIRTIKVAELSRYIWAATSLRTMEENQATLAFNEYIRRLQLDGENENRIVTVEEAAAILWAVGCLKDTFGWTSPSLITLLFERLDDENGEAISSLSSKLIVRVLWSLALHNRHDADLCRYGLIAIESRGLDNLSGANAINLLWSIAQVKDLIDVELLLSLLKRVQSVIENTESQLGVTEISLASDALVTLHESAQAITYSYQSQQKDAENASQNLEPEKLLSILAMIESNMRALVDSFTANATASGFKSISHLISILRAAASGATTSPVVWEMALSHMENSLKLSANITVLEASNILEIITHIPQKMYSQQLYSSYARNEEVPTSSISDSISSPDTTILPTVTASVLIVENSLNAPKGLRLDVDGTVDPRWHGVAGRLAAISAVNAGQTKDKNCLINACWALASLGYPYRKLLTAVRKCIQFALHELSPNMLARLVVAVAAEECLMGASVTAGASGLRASPKLDREFVDQVALSVYHNLADMTPLVNQINAMVAAACLGRLTSFEMRTHSADTDQPLVSSTKKREQPRGRQRSVTISSDQLKGLKSSVLIRLFWSMHRLPDGVVAADTMKLVQAEIGLRDLSPFRLALDATAEEPVSQDDLKLLARVLSESKALTGTDNQAEESARTTCSALLNHLKAQPELTPRSVLSFSNTYVRAQMAAEAASLCDVLQSFIDLKWHNAEASLHLVEQSVRLSSQLESFTNHLGDDDGLCACAYHLGRFQELLKIFTTLPASKVSDGRYDIGKQLSRWLGM